MGGIPKYKFSDIGAADKAERQDLESVSAISLKMTRSQKPYKTVNPGLS
jgi:hypothetical protein